jgi:hypothetical protein
MLVGDLIIQCREQIPDMPGTLLPPILDSVTPIAGTALSGPDTWSITLTFLNQWGETSPSATVTAVITGSTGDVSIVLSGILASTTTLRIYAQLPSQNSGLIFQIPTTSINNGTFTLGQTVLQPINTLPQTPPIRNSAFLPDTDGSMLSATSVFRYLSQALTEASREVGGILDYTGVSSNVGQPMYVLQGEWLSLTDVWYDGYPVSQTGRNTFFRRNTVQSSILGAVTVSVRDNRVIAEVWPQPARTAASTTTTAQVNVGDTTINISSGGGFVLPFGFAQVGTEVVSYATVGGTQLTGCVRGLSGGVAYAWPTSTVVNELNLFMCGKRIFTAAYAPGTGATLIPVPAGWDEMLVSFMLSKVKQTEQDYAEAARLRKLFDELLTGFVRANRQIAGPRQVTLRDEEFSIANPHPFGGTVIP